MKPLTMAGAVCLLLLGGTRVEAQGVASTFDQLTVLVMAGDEITVVDLTGREADGRIGRLSRDTLTLITRGGLRHLSEAEVAQIRKRRGDSLTNGAIIGAVTATAYVLTMLAVLGDSDGGDIIVSRAIIGTGLFAGMGAAAGAGIDALITRRQVIYRNPASKSRVSISPQFCHGRRGAAVTVKF